MKRQVTICDNTFLPYGAKACNLGGANHGRGPKDFEWVAADSQTARFVTDGDIKHARGRGQVAWLLEPYSLHPENYHVALARQAEFEAVLSHNMFYGNRWYPYGGSWIAPEKWGVGDKTKNVSMLLSEKRSMPGHKLRHEVARTCNRHVESFFYVPTDQKERVLAPFRYSVVIENERSAWWFTEHLLDCLCVGTVPVYWGAPGISKFFNPEGIIEVQTLADIQSLLPYLDESQYHLRLGAVHENVRRCADWFCAEDYIYTHYPELFP